MAATPKHCQSPQTSGKSLKVATPASARKLSKQSSKNSTPTVAEVATPRGTPLRSTSKLTPGVKRLSKNGAPMSGVKRLSKNGTPMSGVQRLSSKPATPASATLRKKVSICCYFERHFLQTILCLL